jgi:N-acetylmuramoyl-L-alanine amidase
MSLHLLQSPSPNYDARKDGKKPSLIILHYTGMPEADDARLRLCDAASKVSAHYLIERGGQVWQLVAESERAWHAGVGAWQAETDINSASIGIELVNRGHQWGYQTFPEPQIAAVKALLRDIQTRYAIPSHNILGHSDVAPQRKEDPGEFFPWHSLASEGIGLWPAATIADDRLMEYAEARRLLRSIGYDCVAAGEYDLPLRRVMLAFQRHWLPRHLSGLADKPTAAMLRAVAAAYTHVRR